MSRWMLFAVVMLSVTSFVGCGPTAKDKLTGKWAGTIEVDQAALDAKIASMDNPVQARIMSELLKGMASGATFDVELKSDGNMTSRFKSGPFDKQQNGTWAVKSEEGNKVTLTLTEDGKPHDESVTLTEGGFIMDAPGEGKGIARVVFRKA